eukprot:2763303-Alexandrium_andersonii.AAC.1
MSASLVGSEMCIRDSLKWPGEQNPADVFTEAVNADLINRHMQFLSPPVSYTHLTLPTICSV